MGRWTTSGIAVIDESAMGCGLDSLQAKAIAKKHNADCDAYEARIAALEAALETESQWLAEYQAQRDNAVDRLARIAELVKPVPVADLVEAGTEAPRLLAERHRQIRAILEEENNE